MKTNTVRKGFTLIELLVVIAIIVVVVGLVFPAFNGIKGGQDVTKAAYDIAGILDQARAYAMSNSTYVYVGFSEVDSSNESSIVPQRNTGATAIGRVAVAVVATKDGTAGYPGGSLNNWITNYLVAASPAVATSSNFVPLNKVQYFDSLHMVDLAASAAPAPSPGTGMYRPYVSVSGTAPNYNIGNAQSVSSTPFAWPIGTSVPATSATAATAPTQYSFYKVIQFDSQGVARIQYSSANPKVASTTVPSYMEIFLQPTHGNGAPPAITSQNAGDFAAVQIDCMTGATRIYRP